MPPEDYWKTTQRFRGEEILFFSAVKTWSEFERLVDNIPAFPMKDTPEARSGKLLNQADVISLCRDIRRANATAVAEGITNLPDIWGLREAVVRLLQEDPTPPPARKLRETLRDH